jgi:hypothetical protein
MAETESQKYIFTCFCCGTAVRLLAREELTAGGRVLSFIRRRCRTCETNGAIAKGTLQVFLYQPPKEGPAGEERVPASEKYV